MAKVSVTTETPEEAATLATALEKHGPDVVNELVSNWIAERADTYHREHVDAVAKASKLDPTYAAKVRTLGTDAQKIVAADAKKKADDAAKASASIDGKK